MYVAAEGILGYAPRVEAWLEANPQPEGSEPPSVHFLSHPVQIGEGVDNTDTGLDAFVEQLASQGIRPALIILDTLSRCLSGTDENSTRALSEMVTRCERAAMLLGAAFLLVHHTRKRDDEIRGSGTLAGAANMMASVKLLVREKTVKFVCTKMKDGERFKPLEFDFQSIGPSAVLTFNVEATKEDSSDEQEYTSKLSANDQFPAEGASTNAWYKAAETRAQTESITISRETIYRGIRRLHKRGFVTLVGQTYRVTTALAVPPGR